MQTVESMSELELEQMQEKIEKSKADLMALAAQIKALKESEDKE